MKKKEKLDSSLLGMNMTGGITQKSFLREFGILFTPN